MAKEDTQALLKAVILRLLPNGLTPKKMLSTVKAEFPKASKSEITRAAFAAMIEMADTDLTKSRALHGAAMDLRKSGAGGEGEVFEKTEETQVHSKGDVIFKKAPPSGLCNAMGRHLPVADPSYRFLPVRVVPSAFYKSAGFARLRCQQSPFAFSLHGQCSRGCPAANRSHSRMAIRQTIAE